VPRKDREARNRYNRQWRARRSAAKKKRDYAIAIGRSRKNWRERNEWHRQNYKKFREAILKRLGSICKRCGFADKRALQIDHVHGGGKREIGKGYSYVWFLKLLADPNLDKKYQLLCANCNWIKRAERREFTKRRTV